ncbi:hypothetical protein NCS56_01040800 [Fusarium sp. Ph1]|nr:hypothetical protein NCS56_01040800 [Fusarium sp. Ph1]
MTHTGWGWQGSGRNGNTGFKLTDIGLFWPDAPSKGKSEYPPAEIFYDKTTAIFTDAHLWVDSVRSHMEGSSPQQVMFVRENAWRLMRGSALVWWRRLLDDRERQSYIASIDAFLDAVKTEFGMELQEALEWLDQAYFNLEDIESDRPLRDFSARVFDVSRVVGRATDLELLTRFYAKLHPELRQLCRPPDGTDERSKYVSMVDGKRKTLREKLKTSRSGKGETGGKKSRSNGKHAYITEERKEEESDQEDSALWGNDRPWNRGHRDRNRLPRSWRPREIGDNTERRTGKAIRHEETTGNPQRNTGTSLRRRNRNGGRRLRPGKGGVKIKEDPAEETPIRVTSDPKALAETDDDSQSEGGPDESDESAAYYAEITSNNEETYLATEQGRRSRVNFALDNGQIIEAIGRPDFSNQLEERALTHLRIPLTFEGTKDAKIQQVCCDSGASATVVDKRWLAEHGKKVVWKDQEPKTLSGIGKVTSITKSATFDFYLPGTVRGTEVKAHFTVTADVVDQLTPNLLLGTGFLYEHGAKVDFVNPSVSFRSAHGITIRGEIFRKRVSPFTRAVKSAYAVTIKKGETAFIPVTYKNLPETHGSEGENEAFYFQGKDRRFFDSTIDKSTPKMVIFHNPGTKDIQIHRRQLIGHIRNYEGNETANLITSPSGSVDFHDVIGRDFQPGAKVENLLATGTLSKQPPETSEEVVRDDPKLVKAANYLSQFELRIFYVPGALNVIPDALSRLPVEDRLVRRAAESSFDELDFVVALAEVGSMQIGITPEFRRQIIEGYSKDSKLGRIRDYIIDIQGRERQNRRPKTVPFRPWELAEDLLYHVGYEGKRRLCIPRPLVKSILEIVHDNKHHFGINRMQEELDAVYFYRMSKTIRGYVAFCPVCHENSTSRKPTQGELQSIAVIPRPFHTIALDFITDLPEVSAAGTMWFVAGQDKLDCLATVNCVFSKKTMLLAGHTSYTAEDWAIVLIRMLFMLDWGIPVRIISDRDPKFTSQIWRAVFGFLRVDFLMSAAYHPQTDGISERKNQTVETAIRYHTATDPDTPWPTLLPSLQHNLNNAVSNTIGRAPNDLIYGFRPRGLIDLAASSGIKDEEVDAQALEALRKIYYKEAEFLIDTSASLAKIRYDAKHEEINIEEGDTVYLRLHKGYHLPGKPKKKWSPTRAGPYKVIRKIGSQAFKLDFPEHWRIHPVVSIAHLWKPAQGEDPYQRTIPPPAPVAIDDEEVADHWEVERIVQQRIRWKNKRPYRDLLVRWTGFTAKDDNWIAEPELRNTARSLVEAWKKANPVDWELEFRKKKKNIPKTFEPDEE